MPHPSFIDRYEVLGLLGAGGMGAVYRARDPQIGGRLVAIKLLRRDQYADVSETAQLRQRFVQEAHAAGRIESEHVVRIFDVREHEGEPFIAMEFIDGETLAALIKRREPIPLLRKLELISHLCEGVAAAHECGIVHRDIKPLNIVVDRRGRLKILDFGIAKMTDSGMHTATGFFMGSCNYVSPEQASGRSSLDHRSDIFSIGAVFYELLCYRQAFPGTVPGVLHTIISASPDSLADAYSASDALAPGGSRVLDPAIVRIVMRALEKDPASRFQDVGVMRQDVDDVRRRLVSTPAAQEERPAAPMPATVIAPPRVVDRGIEATLQTPRLPQGAVDGVETMQSPPAGVRAVAKHAEPRIEERRTWRPRALAFAVAGLAVVAIAAVALYTGLPGAPVPKEGSSPPPEAASAERRPPETESEFWAAAAGTRSADDYEAYLRFLKERGLSGEHRAEAQAQLASLWAPAAAPAFPIVDRGPLFEPKGYQPTGCRNPTPIFESQRSADGKTILYLAPSTCDLKNDETWILSEVEGRPADVLGEGKLRMTNQRALSRDGVWDVLAFPSTSLMAHNTRTDQSRGLATAWGPDGEFVDASLVTISKDGSVIAVGSRSGSVAIFNRDSGRGEDLPWTADAKVNGFRVGLSSMTPDDKFLVIEIAPRQQTATWTSDRWKPGFYLYDRDTKRASLVATPADMVLVNDGEFPVVASESGDWIVFVSTSGSLSLVRDGPPGSEHHLYARHVRTGHTWLVHSAPALDRMDYALAGRDLLVLATGAGRRSRVVTIGGRKDSDDQISWRTLPNGNVSSRQGVLDDLHMGPDLRCVSTFARELLCPVP